MDLLGNILWFILGGLLSGILWCIYGAFFCITIIGIPFGLQCFKFAKLTFWPFGKEIIYGGGGISLLANIIWILLAGLEMAIASVLIGILCCVTIIGIPFGLQHFKLAKLALLPFGSKVQRIKETM